MGTLGAIISSISSLTAKLLPQSSSSSSSDEDLVIEEELNKLSRTLERIRVTLDDAEERAIRDKAVKHWLKELKQVAYAAEDVLDEYQYEVLRTQVESRGDLAECSRKRKKLELSHDLADRINRTISLFDEIAKHRDALQLREEDGHRNFINETQITPTSHMVVESNIYGREDEKEILIKLLCSDNNKGDVISVVAIVGAGGLGKTTVAQLVYNDPRIQEKFDERGWVCVSDDFSVQRLTKDVVESIKEGSCDIINLSVLQENLKNKIKGKMMFLVLDDVWNENISDWELFRIPFLSAKLVKIVVTTRNEPVAAIMRTVPSFNLGYLSEKQCWQLFQQFAFVGVNCNDEWKLKIGKQIMKKCGMLPLAVKSIASLLRHEESEESWSEILDNELWELESTKEILFPPLQISYSRLPPYLKPCLLYCSMFPKGYYYDVKVLTQLWFAQGYIEPKGRKNIEEIGQDYVKQLLDRSLFEYTYNDKRNRFSSFKLHDMVHLALSNSGNEFYSIEAGKPRNFPEQIRHLYVVCDGLVELFPPRSFTDVRTLITGYRVKNCAIISDISEAHALRAVVFESQWFGFGFFNSIDNLKHLRYISLQRFDFEMLPESICSLYNLQFLYLIQCCDLIELPNGMGNLINLQFLSLIFCPVLRLPESICHLRNLKELIVDSYKLEDCGRLVELPEHIGNIVSLEKLQVNGSIITVLPASLSRLTSLRILELTSYEIIEELPHWIGSLTNLQTLIVSKVSSPPLRLNKLTKIRVLNLEFDIIACNNHYEFGWLNDILDLGALIIFGPIETSLTYSKGEYETLSWYIGDLWYTEIGTPKGITVKIRNEEGMDLIFLERFQPPPTLEMLEISNYPGITLPKWTGDLLACTSLERVCLEGCYNLVFHPFNNRQNIKYLEMRKCHGLELIQPEFVSSQLRELVISSCNRLICVPGVQNLKSLVKLEIVDCPNLKSLLKGPEPSLELTMFTQPEPSLELIMFTNDSFHRALLMGLTNLTSLRILKIDACPKLRVIADELCPLESCIVEIRACPNLREWCLQHNFGYFED